MKSTYLVALLVALTLAVPSAADDEPKEESSSPSLAAAGWCPVRSGEREEGDPGCDAGAAAALYKWKRAAVVGVIGSKTVGAGVAWVVAEPERGPVIGVAAGVVAPYSSDGIDFDRWAPAVGATFSFGGPR